jgi:hypothetical protein
VSFGTGGRFTVRGRLDGRDVSLAYDPGRLTGDGQAVARVHEVLEQRGVLRLTEPGDEHPATIDDPYAVMAAIQEVIDIDEVEGDYPIPEADDSAT